MHTPPSSSQDLLARHLHCSRDSRPLTYDSFMESERIGDLARMNVLGAVAGTLIAVGLYTWLGTFRCAVFCDTGDLSGKKL